MVGGGGGLGGHRCLEPDPFRKSQQSQVPHSESGGKMLSPRCPTRVASCENVPGAWPVAMSVSYFKALLIMNF